MLIYIFYEKYYVHKIFRILSQQNGRLLLWTKSNFISGFKLELITTYHWNLLWKYCENSLNVAFLIFYNQNGKEFLRFVNEQGFIPLIPTLFNFVNKLTGNPSPSNFLNFSKIRKRNLYESILLFVGYAAQGFGLLEVGESNIRCRLLTLNSLFLSVHRLTKVYPFQFISSK